MNNSFLVILSICLLSSINIFAQREFEGTWSSDFGELRLHQIGNEVFGDYHKHGIIEGTYKRSSKTLDATFTYLDASGKRVPSKVGKLKFVLKNGAFTGKWAWGNKALTSKWNGKRKTTGEPTLNKYKIGFGGVVWDKKTKAKLGNAQIIFAKQNGVANIKVITKSNGRYRVALPKGDYRVVVKKSGCKPYTMKGAEKAILSKDSYQTFNFELSCNGGTTKPTPTPTTKSFDFSQNKNKLIVLVHGITTSEKSDKKKAASEPKKEMINKKEHAQFYWGFHFIRTLLKETKSTEPLYHYVNGSKKTTIAKRSWDKHINSVFSSGIPKGIAPVVIAGNQYNNKIPKEAVMVTFRDGSLSLGKQVKAAINQIYDSYNHYYKAVPEKDKPMLYMVCHSFGGVVIRALISNPTQKINGEQLTTEERKRADFIRNRIVWVTTMATPHQGSAGLPEKGQLADKIDFLADKIKQELTANASVKSSIGDLKVSLGSSTVIDKATGQLRSGAKHLRNSYNSASCKDINSMKGYNKNLLSPEKGKRTDGSLIPIYTLTGRNPGANYYLKSRKFMSLTENSISEINDHYSNFGANKIAAEAFKGTLGEMIGKSYYKPGLSSWGRPEIPEGDLFSVGAFANKAPYTKSLYIDGLFGKGLSVKFKKDNIYDSDILVGFDSGHGLKLGTNTLHYFSNTNRWSKANNKFGSWYRLYQSKYGPLFPWDYDNHRSYMYNTGVAAFIQNYLVAHAGPKTGNKDFSTWSNGKTVPALKTKKIHVCIKYIGGKLDGPTGRSDFFGIVQIGSRIYKKTGTSSDDNELFNSNAQPCIWRWTQQVKGTIIPVRIDIYDADDGLTGEDDHASISKRAYVEGILFYVDLQNGRVYGDVEGTVRRSIKDKATFWVEGYSKDEHKAKIGFSIVVE